jgi:hypothetical protein
MYVDIKTVLKTIPAAFRRLLVGAIVFSLALATPVLGQATPAEAANRTYYLDCNTGSDSDTGLSPSQAWKSLNKANAAPLAPGDSLLLLRGCTWTGTLRATWQGTSSATILIGAYGSGALPKIQNSAADLLNSTYTSVDISGSYQIIENLQTTVVNPPVDPNCLNTPIGFFVGFNFRNPNNTANGGSFNTLRYSQATRAMAGVHFNNNTHNDRVLNNTFTDNNVMMVLTPKSVKATDDIGAWGILVKGRNQEIAYNYLANNNGACAYDTVPQGNSIEVYEAQNSTIHHNTSVNDRVFSELGGSAGMRADGITYAYNLVISTIRQSHFIVARGGGNPFGPTYRTKLYNNTVYYTGAESEGIICGAGCSPTILEARNNIIWAEMKAAYSDAAFTESNNVYWSTNGQPFVQFQNFAMSPSSKLANPRFVGAGSNNFRLQSTSPAINAGALVGWSLDMVGIGVPQSSKPDMGVYESAFTQAPEEVPPLVLPYSIWLPLVPTTP